MLTIRKASRPPLPPLDSRERAVARGMVAAARAVGAGTKMGKLIEALESTEPTRAIDAVNWEAAGVALLSTLPKQYVITHQDSQQHGKKLLQRALKKAIGYSLDRTNPESVTWAENRSGWLIRAWGDSSRAALRVLITRSFEEGIPPRQLAKLIVESGIGLTERQALAVVRRRSQLLKDGLPLARVESLVERYSGQLLRARGEAIARTEIIAAHTAGAQASWNEAVQEGLLNPQTARQAWAADPDERTCPICEGLDGEEVPLGGTFPGGYSGPPAHPLCRCGLNVRP